MIDSDFSKMSLDSLFEALDNAIKDVKSKEAARDKANAEAETLATKAKLDYNATMDRVSNLRTVAGSEYSRALEHAKKVQREFQERTSGLLDNTTNVSVSR